MTAKTTAQRQAAYKLRQLEAGYKLVWVWVHPDDNERLKKYAQRLREKREKLTL